MTYYSKFDHDLDAKLRHLNQAVVEGWLSRHEALAKARTLDPDLSICPVCGEWPCDCTIRFDPRIIQEAIKNHV